MMAWITLSWTTLSTRNCLLGSARSREMGVRRSRFHCRRVPILYRDPDGN